jgi:N-methylhydantoinase B
VLELPDGSRRTLGKATGVPVPAGAVLHLHTGGGGGFGPPAERDPAAVHEDVREGYVSEAAARRDYPHAFVDS